MINLGLMSIACLCVVSTTQGSSTDFPVKGAILEVPKDRAEAFYSLSFFSTGISLPHQLERIGRFESLLNKAEHHASYTTEQGEKGRWRFSRATRDGFLVLSHVTTWGKSGSMKSEITLKLLDAKVGAKRMVTVIPISFTLQSTTYKDAEVMARLGKMMDKELFMIELQPSDPRSVEGIVALSFLRASTLAPQRYGE